MLSAVVGNWHRHISDRKLMARLRAIACNLTRAGHCPKTNARRRGGRSPNKQHTNILPNRIPCANGHQLQEGCKAHSYIRPVLHHIQTNCLWPRRTPACGDPDVFSLYFSFSFRLSPSLFLYLSPVAGPHLSDNAHYHAPF
eukprot:3421689-Pyramimonas_sp.AAC.2